MIISMLGAPGCGKGTQAKKLSAYYGIPHISTGDIFRKAISEGTPVGLIAKEYMSTLVPDEIVIDLVKERLAEPDCQKGVILDGFPRSVNQAKSYLENGKFDRVIYFNINEDIVIDRILSRRTCGQCGEIYSIKDYTKATCEKCSGELIIRKEDTKIQERIDTYKKETYPLVEYFKNEGVLFQIDIDKIEATEPSEQIKEVFQKIINELDGI